MEIAKQAIQLFNIQGAVDSIAPFGLGHINDSFIVKTDSQEYLLQRLNSNVFRNPETIENNLSRVLISSSELFPTHIGGASGAYHQFDDKSFWRLQEFVQESYSPTDLTLDELGQLAKGFGRFTAKFSENDPKIYKEAIPRFHDLHFRLAQLEEALEQDLAKRKESTSAEIEAVLKYKWIAHQFDELVKQGLPERVCHNDAKAGNCLLSQKTGEFLKVVDLDTIGSGYALFDLGDILRSALFNIPENEAELNGLQFNQKRFDIIMNSFLEECRSSLSTIEIESLPFGGLYMTYIMATRFLTDYLNGDVYYKVSHPKENLVRTRNQLRILDLMNSAF